jgi:hypothetical protein
MRRIKILRKGLREADVNALSALLTKAGFSAKEIEIIGSIGEPDVNCEDELFAVLLSSENPELEKDLAASHRGGRRTICIWPANARVDSEPPDSVLKHAYSVVPWNADKVRAAAANDDVLCFERPDGQPLPKAETERNLCVEEAKKAE